MGVGGEKEEMRVRGRFLQHETTIHINYINILASKAQIHQSIIRQKTCLKPSTSDLKGPHMLYCYIHNVSVSFIACCTVYTALLFTC